MYKNRVQQQDGWNAEILEWCLMEAKARNLKEEDYWGGFVIDEMKIQVHYKADRFLKMLCFIEGKSKKKTVVMIF